MAWALVKNGEVVTVMPRPPDTLTDDAGNTVMGASGLTVEELHPYGWLPILDEGVTYDPGIQEWDGQPPQLQVRKSDVLALYTVRDIGVGELRARLGDPTPEQQAVDATLDPAHVKAVAEERKRMQKAPRSDFAEGDQSVAPFLD